MAAIEVVAAGVGLIGGCVLFRDTLDPRRIFNWPVKVNCWFCCNDTRVPYQSRKAWHCPRVECSQYNGFDADGGYSKEIVEQHLDPAEKVGGRQIRYSQKLHTSKNVPNRAVENEDEINNGLCQTCNLNQDLKIHQLRTFVARNENDYDQEVQEYAAHLERTYRLCRYCEASLHQKLGEQDSWLKPKLLGWKLERNRQSPLTSSNNFVNSGSEKFRFLARIYNLLFRISIIVFAMFVSYLTCFDVFSFKAVRNMTGEFLRTQHIVSDNFEFGTFLSSKRNMFNISKESLLPLEQVYTQMSLIKELRQDLTISSLFMFVLLGFVYFYNIVYESIIHKLCLASWAALTLQVILAEKQIIVIPDYIIAIIAVACLSTSLFVSAIGFDTKKTKRNQQQIQDYRKQHNTLSQKWQLNDQKQQESILEDTLTHDLVSTSTPVGSIIASTYNSFSQSPGQVPSIAPSILNLSNNSILPQLKNFEQVNTSGTHCDISTLHIASNQTNFAVPDRNNSDASSMISGAFSLKRYDIGNHSGIDFGDLTGNNNGSRKGPLVKPPKFRATNSNRRGVAQSSWVAGGYWLNNKYQQNKVPKNAGASNCDLPETLSRNSSQSSGFVSYSGQPSVSRNANVFNNSNVRSELNLTNPSNFVNQSSESYLRNQEKRTNILTESLYKYDTSKSNALFSLNPINDQLAFFETPISTKQGYSRPNSPFLFSKENQVNELHSQSRNSSRMSKNFNSLKCNERDPDNLSFNSSLDRLTQEAFLELQPNAESSPKNILNEKGNKNTPQPWMEQKITINISFYSILMFLSVAANVALTIYFMS